MVIDENAINKAALKTISSVAGAIWDAPEEKEAIALNMAHISGICDLAFELKSLLNMQKGEGKK